MKFLALVTITILSVSSGSAQALEWICGKSVERRTIMGQKWDRPSLLVKTKTDKNGQVYKQFRAMLPMNEDVSDFLMSVDKPQNVCIKTYNIDTEAPQPVTIYDIKAE